MKLFSKLVYVLQKLPTVSIFQFHSLYKYETNPQPKFFAIYAVRSIANVAIKIHGQQQLKVPKDKVQTKGGKSKITFNCKLKQKNY